MVLCDDTHGQGHKMNEVNEKGYDMLLVALPVRSCSSRWSSDVSFLEVDNVGHPFATKRSAPEGANGKNENPTALPTIQIQ